jgi:hypothetical protein
VRTENRSRPSGVCRADYPKNGPMHQHSRVNEKTGTCGCHAYAPGLSNRTLRDPRHLLQSGSNSWPCPSRAN